MNQLSPRKLLKYLPFYLLIIGCSLPNKSTSTKRQGNDNVESKQVEESHNSEQKNEIEDDKSQDSRETTRSEDMDKIGEEQETEDDKETEQDKENDENKDDNPQDSMNEEDKQETIKCFDKKFVRFVLFVEKDQEYNQEEYDRLIEFAFSFQQYWFEQLGATFFLHDPAVTVINGDNDSQWYVDTPDGIHSDSRWYRLGNIKNEVYQKLGIDDFNISQRIVNYPKTQHDGRVGANFGGAWMDGDDLACIPNGTNYPFNPGTPAHCMGHVAHEFGHILGLDHEGPDTDCMQFGFYNNSGGDGMCSFSRENVRKILNTEANDNWFNAKPGDTCSSE